MSSEEKNMDRTLLMDIFKVSDQELDKIIELAIKSKEAFGEDIFSEIVDAIYLYLEPAGSIKITEVVYTACINILEKVLKTKDFDLSIYDRFLSKNCSDPHFKFILDDLEGLEMSEDLRRDLINKFNTFLGK